MKETISFLFKLPVDCFNHRIVIGALTEFIIDTTETPLHNMKRRYRACKCEGTAKVSDENAFFFMKPWCLELIKLLKIFNRMSFVVIVGLIKALKIV